MLIGHGDLPVLAVIVRDDALLLNMSSDVYVFGYPALVREPVGRAR
jgi:hypothetical protein